MSADRITLSSSREDAKRRAFAPDMHRAWLAIGEYLACHSCAPEDAANAREDAVAAMYDAMTGDELRAGAKWADEREAVGVRRAA